MSADHSRHPVVHLVGSIPLPDAETVFRTVSGAVGPHLTRLPDGETGIRKTWIRFLQDVLADNPAIELASDVPPFKFVQWDGKVVREIPRLRVKAGATPVAGSFKTGYADMAIQSWGLFDRLQQAGAIPPKVKFQICIPTPIAPTYNNMVPSDRPKLLPALTEHFAGEVAKIAQALPNDRIALQWDVCQEVLAWEGYYEPGPVDFRTETIEVLSRIGNAVPARIELGYHLCYGSPADEHMVQPKDAGIMVEIANAVVAKVARPIQFFHMPVVKARTDDAYFAPLKNLKLRPGTELYLGLVHYNDASGDAVPPGVELGYHLCYGSPADEHLVQPRNTGIMVEMTNAIVACVRRPIQFFHMPVPKARTDDAYFLPLERLQLRPETELYLGLIHHDDAAGDAARLAAARRHVRVDGIATECGMARGDPARLPALLAAHVRAAQIAA